MQDQLNVRPIAEMLGQDAEDGVLLRQQLQTARQFLTSFAWCRGIRQEFFGAGVGGIVGVFLFEIDTASEDVDRWLWVVTGDIPPAYLVTDNIRSPNDAMRVYAAEMRAWVAAVRAQRPLQDLIPVNAQPTPAAARDLEARLNFIEKEIIR